MPKPKQHTRKPTAKRPRPRSGAKRPASSDAPHAGRDARVCPVSDRCGGCTRIEQPYAEQLAAKQAAVEELFAGDVARGTVIRPVVGMDDPTHYRNKVISPYVAGAPVKRRQSGRTSADRARAKGTAGSRPAPREILTGMYARGTHDLIPTDTCLVENENAKRITLAVRDIMARHGMEPYDEDAGTGFMRHCVVRVGHESGEVLVTLVTNGEDFPSSKAFCRELVKRCPSVTTVVQNVNTRQTNVILGDRQRTLYGPGFILDTLCGLSFRISSQSFYQVNSVQTEVLYRTAVELAALTPATTVIDAYCGTGTIGLVAAASGAGRVIGVDNVASAIEDARQNARHNGIETAEFVAADAGAFLRDMAARGVDGPLVLLMDPPRSGSTEEFLEAACALAPDRIVYISCNPTTQKRDIDYLVPRGYRLQTVVPVDMFPHTDHIETVALLVRETAVG